MDLNLETKFIEGTNNQYSIRNDGVVISNRFNKELSFANSWKSITIYINKKRTVFSSNKLLEEYFGYHLCNSCNNRIYNDKRRVKCSDCHCLGKKRRNEARIKWRAENPILFKAQAKRKNDHDRSIISKGYISTILKIQIQDLDEDFYQAAKTRLILSRKLKQLQNGQKEPYL
jgi:hypothetical protein